MRIRTVSLTLALAALTAAGIAGCGGSSGGPGVATAAGGTASAHPSPTKDSGDQRLAFAQCMREHGVDIPDLGAAGNAPVHVTASGGAGATQAALRACQSLLPNGGTVATFDPARQQELLAYAQCMRAHGVNMPDPDPNGGLTLSKGGLSPTDPTFQAAETACQDKLSGNGGGK